MASQPTAYRLEFVPATACRLRWLCTLYGFTASGTRRVVSSKAIYEDSTNYANSLATRLISNNPAPTDELSIYSFQIEPLAVASGTTLVGTLQLGEVDPANPIGASLSTKTLDIVTLDLSLGQLLQLDATSGGWRIATKVTSYPLLPS